jgi:hypothetical protein
MKLIVVLPYVSRLYVSKEGGYGVSTRQKAEFQENSAIPQPIETAIVTHGVKNHKHLGTAILLLASLLTNFRKKLWNVEDQPEGQQ